MTKHERSITIPLFGGFGNQLFALAAGLYFRDRLDLTIRLDPSFQMLAELVGNTRRKVEVGDVSAVDLEIVSRSYLRSFKLAFLRFASRTSWISETSTTRWDSVLYRGNLRVIYGYFQDRQIVDSCFPALCEALATSSSFVDIFNGEVVNRIGVHLRLGDKLSVNSHFGETSTDYYIRAIQLAHQTSRLSQVSIVSDQPAKATNIIAYLKRQLPNLDFELASKDSYFDDFHTLIWSKSIVMSCSSFSWWASRFADSFHEPTVIAPSPWSASNLSLETRLNYPHWNVIPKVRLDTKFHV